MHELEAAKRLILCTEGSEKLCCDSQHRSTIYRQFLRPFAS